MKRFRGLLLMLPLLYVGAAFAQQETYDHFRHGFDLEGAHAYVACESCHARGNFAGTPRECSICHDGSGQFATSARPPDHIATTQLCDTCHITESWQTIAEVDHTQVIGVCVSCHNGIQAEGLPPGHIQTSAPCDSCHNTTVWDLVTFDHSGITSSCASCHNGIEATGKSANHIQTTNVCEDCHTVDFWEPVITVDHTQVLGSCASCHDGLTATGKHPAHITSSNQCDDCHTTVAWTPAVFDHSAVMPGTCSSCHDGITATGKNAQHISTSSQCDVCHTTIAWSPATFDHTGVTGSCSTCHNGIQATGTPNGHFQTTRECDYCHTTDFWSPDTFTHSSPSYPGDHRNNLACTDCHSANAEAVTWTSAAYQPDCAGCHANDYRTGPHKKYENPDTSYTVSELRDCTGACHVYTDSSLTTVKEFRPGPEHQVNAGDF